MSELQTVDSVEALINWLSQRDEIAAVVPQLKNTGEIQISDEQKFGADQDAWPVPSRAIQLSRDGGTPQIYLESDALRVELRLYGATYSDAQIVYSALVKALRSFNRETVPTEFGLALIYLFNLSTSPSRFIDPDVKVPCLLLFADAEVSEIDAAI